MAVLRPPQNRAPRSFTFRELSYSCVIIIAILVFQTWMITIISLPTPITENSRPSTYHDKNGSTYYHPSTAAIPTKDEFENAVTTSTKPSFYVFPYPSSLDSNATSLKHDKIRQRIVTKFISGVFSSVNRTHPPPIVVDLGAGNGFHSLHMAMLGARVISFEPVQDSLELFVAGARLNDVLRAEVELTPGGEISVVGNETYVGGVLEKGGITVVRAAASNEFGVGALALHSQFPGMASVVKGLKEFGFSTKGGNATLVRVDSVLENVIGEKVDESDLLFLKVETHGYEYQALQGVNLTKFPFRYLTFDFCPSMVILAGLENPIDFLVDVYERGYHFLEGGKSISQFMEGGNSKEGVRKIGAMYMNHMKRSKKFCISLFAKFVGRD